LNHYWTKGSFQIMTPSAHDIAAAVRERMPGVGQKKLHKLLYYCQGHHLATFGRPLFSEQIQAWDMGPVVASLWRDEKYGEPQPQSHILDEGALNTVGYVVSRYGSLNGDQLERLTHSEHPWRAGNARRLVGDSDRIEQGWIRAYFAHAVSNDQEDDQDALDPELVSAWLASTRPRDDAPPPRQDSREALLARLTHG
jgi:uncharacterized phage-associated protein